MPGAVGAERPSEALAAVLLGAGAPTATALVAGERAVTYAELRSLVATRAATLDLAPRSLVVVRAAPFSSISP